MKKPLLEYILFDLMCSYVYAIFDNRML